MYWVDFLKEINDLLDQVNWISDIFPFTRQGMCVWRYPQQLQQLLLCPKAYPSFCFFITIISRFFIPQLWVPTVSGCYIIRMLHLLGKFTERAWQPFNSWDHWKAELQDFHPFRGILKLAVYWALVVSLCPYSGQSLQSIGFIYFF